MVKVLNYSWIQADFSMLMNSQFEVLIKISNSYVEQSMQQGNLSIFKIIKYIIRQ